MSGQNKFGTIYAGQVATVRYLEEGGHTVDVYFVWATPQDDGSFSAGLYLKNKTLTHSTTQATLEDCKGWAQAQVKLIRLHPNLVAPGLVEFEAIKAFDA